MKYVVFISLLSICSLFGCASVSSNNNHNILNESLKSSYNDLENSLKKDRSNLLFNNDEVANNCNSYFLLNSKYEVEESIYNQQVKSEYLICDALEILISSSEGTDNKATDLTFGKTLSSKLDVRTFPSSLMRVGTEEVHTLSSISPEELKIYNNMVVVETQDWAFTLEVVASANINDNSFSDLIVWVLDESKSGNYRGYSTLIIYDYKSQSQLKATVY
ncbi:hypothetical protein [Colwellia sp. E2M01]|uniref:hypothetical protein n=1 Tax=Colwellia sp. E2M01 TaxID=2841561 RepID=UPI001C09CFF6|nr:hypothetical protein [Colwellia sp. E2M01]MBU2869124.1 hypothetical protein [Colwellia sp. E2M01]